MGVSSGATILFRAGGLTCFTGMSFVHIVCAFPGPSSTAPLGVFARRALECDRDANGTITRGSLCWMPDPAEPADAAEPAMLSLGYKVSVRSIFKGIIPL